MSLNLGSSAIEIAIALSFVFFLLSLIVSAMTEWGARIFKLRSKTLAQGIEGMLGDDKVAKEVLEHPLVRTDLKPRRRVVGNRARKERSPSYIAPKDFSLAFLDVIGGEAGGGTADPVGAAKVEVAAASERHGSELAPQLRAILGEADTSPVRLRVAVEQWFDGAMDRVSGWYTRKTRWISLILAVAVTLALNASALRIAERLEAEPAVRAAVVAKAEAAIEEGQDEGASAGSGDEGEKQSPQAAAREVESAYKELQALELPLLWADDNDPFESWPVFWQSLAGWLITIVAISLGSPFWFDALGRLSRMRSAGNRPEDKAGGTP